MERPDLEALRHLRSDYGQTGSQLLKSGDCKVRAFYSPFRASPSVPRCYLDLSQNCSLHYRSLGEKPGKEDQKIIRAECGVSALVHATPGVTASRFAGRSANRTTPITRNRIKWTDILVS